MVLSPSTSWRHKRPIGVRQGGIPQYVYSLQPALTAYVVNIPRRYLSVLPVWTEVEHPLADCNNSYILQLLVFWEGKGPGC